MPIANKYNPNPSTVDSILRKRQTQTDLTREDSVINPPPQENPKVLGVEMTPDSKDKTFARKVGEDAAMLAYAIPVGLAQAVTHPIQFAKQLPGAVVQSVKDVFDPEYYKAHPLLGVVNVAGFVQPIAGIAKSTAIKTATRTALTVAAREATTLGIAESVARTAINPKVFRNVVNEVAKTGKMELASEVVRNALVKGGVADDIALRVGTSVADNLYSTLSRQSTKLKVMESIAHPVGSSYRVLSDKVQPLRSSIFGDPAKTAVAKLYGAETVAKNPEGFLSIERWAEAQIKERGIENTISNRQRVMQEWVEQNSQWASLTPEERVSHFKNYAEQDLTRLKLHDQTGMDIVTVKALPQNYVDAMVQTIKDAPADLDGKGLMSLMEDNFGADFKNFSAEITAAMEKYADPRAAMIHAVSKLGDSRSTISFAKYSPEIQELAKSLEKSGYRIGYAPKDKNLSFASDIFGGAKDGMSAIGEKDIMAKRTALGGWLDKVGLSGRGIIEGAAEFTYRENFTQRLLGEFSEKFATKGGNIKVGKVYLPVEKVFEWIDKNKALFQQARPRASFPIRTVFDVKAKDLVRAGFDADVASAIESISKQSLRDIPVSITGLGDSLINYMRTSDKTFGSFMGKWYDRYLKLAYLGRYDYSPFFSAQQFLETKIQAALLIKDIKQLVPGGEQVQRLGNWTAEKLSTRLEKTSTYLRKIVAEPPLEDISAVREEILGTLQKTMLDYSSSPDLINISNTAKGALNTLKDKALFEQSIRSRNFWYRATGQSSVRMAATFNRGLAEKFGMSLKDALDFTYEDGVKRYKNPEMVKMMKEATQMAFHYKEGFLTSPLMKTLNIVWFPLRFQAKTMQLMGRWVNSLTPMQKMAVMNNWVHFANWAGTDEGIEWRRTNRNVFYNILAYTTAFEQIGQSIEAVTKGRLFGGNAGLIGGVPFGFIVNLARELAILPEDPDQFDPKTGRRFTKEVPRETVSAATLSAAIEQLLISVSPSTPFYSLTGGVISGVSPRKYIESLVRQVVGAGREAIEGRDPSKGRQQLERDFKRVPLEYSRLTE